MAGLFMPDQRKQSYGLFGSPNPQPQSWGDRLAIIGATLRDVGAQAQNQPQLANNLATYQENMRNAQELLARKQAMQRYRDSLPANQQQLFDIMPEAVAEANVKSQLEPKGPTIVPAGASALGPDNKPIFTAPTKPEYRYVDLGNKVAIMNNSGSLVGTMPKGMTPNAGQPKPAAPLKGADAKLMDTVRDASTTASSLRSLAQEFMTYNMKKATGGVQGSWANAGSQFWDSDIGAMNSLTSRMTPFMRPTGSGATSDYEQRLYRQGVPSADKKGTTNQEIVRNLNTLADISDARRFFYEDYAAQYGSLNGAEQAFQNSDEFRQLTKQPSGGGAPAPKANDGVKEYDWVPGKGKVPR